MNKLHERLIDNINFEPKEGQGNNNDNLSCSNERKSFIPCPSLCFKTKEERVELVKPILKNLINFIIENEIKNYLDNLYAKQTREIKCIDI